jgi:PIN domain
MKVVVDTTVFENGFNSRSADVQLLKSFLTSTQSKLCIPSVVYQEALNRVRKRTAEASKIDSLHRLTGGEEGFQKIKPDEVARSYEGTLKVLFMDLKARFLSYPVISHEDLVKRSMVPMKPFVESGRGYLHLFGTHFSSCFIPAVRM